jgi:hypothetical protein
MRDGTPAIKAISWKEVDEICNKLNGLNPYNRGIIPDILKVEDNNFNSKGKQHQLYGLAVSANATLLQTQKEVLCLGIVGDPVRMDRKASGKNLDFPLSCDTPCQVIVEMR